MGASKGGCGCSRLPGSERRWGGSRSLCVSGTEGLWLGQLLVFLSHVEFLCVYHLTLCWSKSLCVTPTNPRNCVCVCGYVFTQCQRVGVFDVSA